MAARSPLGERLTPVSELAGGAAPPAGWPPAASSLSLSLGFVEQTGKVMK
jgi:hypothetical protein